MPIRPDSALIIVDVQNDFFADGAEPVSDAERIVPRINEYIRLFWERDLPIFAARDWHPPEFAQPGPGGHPGTPHCVRDTWGAEFHPDLKLPQNATILSKGAQADGAGESAYWGVDGRGHALLDWLSALQVRHVYIGGLRLESAIYETVIHTQSSGRVAYLLMDAVQAASTSPVDEERVMVELLGRGLRLCSITELSR